jgi:hypothetical protein
MIKGLDNQELYPHKDKLVHNCLGKKTNEIQGRIKWRRRVIELNRDVTK